MKKKKVPVEPFKSISYSAKEYYDHQYDRCEYHYYRLDRKPESTILAVESSQFESESTRVCDFLNETRKNLIKLLKEA